MTKSKIVILIIILVTLAISSCRTSRISPTQIQLVQYSLKEEDLPGKWNVEGNGWGADYGGESYGITYIRNQYVFVNHIVSLHSSESRAKQAYTEWEAKRFILATLQPELSYIPVDKNDDHNFKCAQLRPDSPVRVCVFLQRHGTIINFVRVSFDNRSTQNLTFEEVNSVLTILDDRLNENIVNTKSEGDTP